MRRSKKQVQLAKHCPEPKLEMTPMIDVVFLLLIFFMVTMNIARLEGLLPQRLPDTAGTRPLTPPDDKEQRVELLVRVTRTAPAALMRLDRERRPASELLGDRDRPGDSQFWMTLILGNAPVLEIQQRTSIASGDPVTTVRLSARGRRVKTPAPLVQRLRAIIAAEPKTIIKIKPDRAATYEAMILALNACWAAGVPRNQIEFAGKIVPH